MINVRGLQRNVKNVVKNYTEAQVKVREATSNDKWGAPSTLMAEIADLTYNVVAFSEIMQMIWKRLNDHGKNWRHVYKALTLLDYLIKAGSEKVAQQCRENIFAIQTLKDFQYIEDNKDQGLNVREKSKALVALLKDEEKLKVERARALKTKERFAQSVSYMSNSASMETLPKTSASYHESLNLERSGGLRSGSAPVNTELEQARPQTIGEEELQLQLALAMSKEEAEADERQRKNDDLRLKLALTESEKEKQKKKASALDDLLSIDLGNNSFNNNSNSSANNNQQQLDPWSVVESNNHHSSNQSNGLDAFGAVGGLGISNNGTSNALAISNDPWSPTSNGNSNNSLVGATSTNFSHIESDPWSPKAITNESSLKSNSLSTSPWQSNSIITASNNNDPWSSPLNSSPTLPLQPTNNHQINSLLQANNTRKTPENFLGANLNLVNLDALVSGKTNATTSNSSLGSNPFASVSIPSNPFQKPPAPTINQLRSQNNFPLDNSNFMSPVLSSSLPSQQNNSLILSQSPLNPTLSTSSNQSNPFAM